MESLVSVIMPTYNSETTVVKSINSVISQSYKNWELLVTDDCSVDKTNELLQEIVKSDKRIKVFTLNKNSGAGIARNNSIKHAAGSFIAFIDSDDEWLPNKLLKQIKFMTSNNYILTFTSYKVFDLNGNFLKDVIAKNKIKYNDMLKSNYIGCSTAIYNSGVIGKKYMPIIRKRQDYGLWIDIIKITKSAYGLEESLTKYNVMTNSISKNKFGLIKHQWFFYRKTLNLNFISSLRSMYYSIYYSLFDIKNKGK